MSKLTDFLTAAQNADKIMKMAEILEKYMPPTFEALHEVANSGFNGLLPQIESAEQSYQAALQDLRVNVDVEFNSRQFNEDFAEMMTKCVSIFNQIPDTTATHSLMRKMGDFVAFRQEVVDLGWSAGDKTVESSPTENLDKLETAKIIIESFGPPIINGFNELASSGNYENLKSQFTAIELLYRKAISEFDVGVDVEFNMNEFTSVFASFVMTCALTLETIHKNVSDELRSTFVGILRSFTQLQKDLLESGWKF
jgi:hypothetical protein